jgi:hypothetical protein
MLRPFSKNICVTAASSGDRETGFASASQRQFDADARQSVLHIPPETAIRLFVMPRGNPGKPVAFRINPDLLAEVKANTSNVTAAVEEGLRLWLAGKQKKAAKGKKAG